jgi:hypothetical protein
MMAGQPAWHGSFQSRSGACGAIGTKLIALMALKARIECASAFFLALSRFLGINN